MTPKPFPPLYAILDAESCTRRGLLLLEVAEAWKAAGVCLVQYRDKSAADAEVLRNALALREMFQDSAKLILNDRVHLFTDSRFDGVHVGQGDSSVPDVRRQIGPDAILGISTHTQQQATEADKLPVDYIAVGPVYTTSTKTDAEPAVGLEGVTEVRACTAKPLVAIGGITPASFPAVLLAGADSVAVISALLDAGPAAFAPLR